MDLRRLAVFLTAGFGLGGCASYLHDTQTRESLSAPAQYAADELDEEEPPAPSLEPGDLVATYSTLVDPRLGPLLQEALRSSPDVVVAIALVEESRAIADQARAARMPTIAATAVAGLSHSITPGLGSVDARTLTFSLPVSYEVDLVGRYAREHRAAQRDALALESDAQAAAMSIAAEVAEAYLDLVVVRAERELLLAQRETNQRLLELTRSRVAAGLASSIDQRQQEQVALGVETLLASVDDRESQASFRLALLLGHEPGSRFDDAPTSLVMPPAESRTEIRADELSGRPDVRSTLLRLAAADDRAAAAVRAEMPSLRLTAAPGYSIVHSESSRGQSSASGFTWSVGGTLTVPIFDGLRSQSIVRQRRAEIDRRLAELDRTLRLAMVEATSALASESQARRTVDALQAQLTLSTELREDTEASYRQGLSPYVSVLLAVVEEQSAARALLDAQRTVLAARTSWVRALAPSHAE